MNSLRRKRYFVTLPQGHLKHTLFSLDYDRLSWSRRIIDPVFDFEDAQSISIYNDVYVLKGGPNL